MIGFDTNVLLRFLIEDDPVQTPRVQSWVRAAAEKGEAIYLSAAVLCETVWVLTRFRKFSKAQVLEVLEELLSTSHVDVDDPEITWAAVHDYALSEADFADCLIRRKALAAGCSELRTFDKKLQEARLV
jgi:predicted nucleic-acid-binding protein